MLGFKLLLVLSVAASATAEIVYPCATTDLTCIGQYLSTQSTCDAASLTEDIDSYTVPFKRVYTPGFNISEDRYDTTYTGISTGVVQDFYVNEETDKVVLTLQFPTLSYRSSSRSVNYYTAGSEPYSVSTGGYTTTLEGLVLTVIFECSADLELSTADIYSYIPNLPTFVSEDDNINTAAKTNAQVAAVLARFQSFRGIPIMEAQYLRAPEIITQFVNGKLCKYEAPASVPDRRPMSAKCGQTRQTRHRQTRQSQAKSTQRMN